jgi:two-component system LytT family sensor kinase
MPANQGCILLLFDRQPCFNELCCQRPGPSGRASLRAESIAFERRHLQAFIIKTSIDMKTSCEACERALPADLEAYVCSFECTFCSDCAAGTRFVCPNCGGELLRRPRRKTGSGSLDDGPLNPPGNRPWVMWAASFGVWSFVAFAATLTIYQLYRSTSSPMPFMTVMGMQFCQILTYAPLTPFAFAFALRYPISRRNWGRRSLLYLAGGLVFTVAHVSLRATTPYAFWDPKYREWQSAIWDSHTHIFRVQWLVLQKEFFSNVVDDITGTFVPIVLVAHAVSYYRKFRERELRAAQLEGQLAKAHLQTLKSQLQPHFLFNTMHSISSLMLIDVQAADQMMTRLGDLLRMSLESAGTQITTLSRELEFVNCYLEIEKVRFAENLTVTLEIVPETLDALVPHLLLQPLVDNAVKHGISQLTAAGEIRITAAVQDGELQLNIEDNGPGCRKEGQFPASGLGLRITRERLESLYGQDQSMELLNLPGGGAVTRVCIPFRVQPGDGGSDVPFTTLRQTFERS